MDTGNNPIILLDSDWYFLFILAEDIVVNCHVDRIEFKVHMVMVSAFQNLYQITAHLLMRGFWISYFLELIFIEKMSILSSCVCVNKQRVLVNTLVLDRIKITIFTG